MAMVPAGGVCRSILFFYQNVSGLSICNNTCEQVRYYAARRGTRMKADKLKAAINKKKAAEAIKLKMLAETAPKKPKIPKLQVMTDDSYKCLPVDDIYYKPIYKWQIMSMEEAITCHREMLHPTIYNVPDAIVNAHIETNLQILKRKSHGAIECLTKIPHTYKCKKIDTKRVLAFCEDDEHIQQAITAGAAKAGGMKLIREIQVGKLSMTDFDYCVAHANILANLLTIRGILKKKFPTIATGTLGNNMYELVDKFANSVIVTITPHPEYPIHGTTNIEIGTLDMDIKQLEENLISILNSIDSKSQTTKQFIKRVSLKCRPSPEAFRISFEHYLPNKEQPQDKIKKKEVEEKEEDDEEDVSAAVIGTV